MKESPVEQVEPLDYSLSTMASLSSIEIQPTTPSPHESSFLSSKLIPDENNNSSATHSTCDGFIRAETETQQLGTFESESSEPTADFAVPTNNFEETSEQIRLSPQLARVLNYQNPVEKNGSLETCTLNLSSTSELFQRDHISPIIESYPDENFKEKVRVLAAYDMGWPTRGSGFQYDSLSGVGVLMGCESGKVLSYATRNRNCRMCNAGNTCHDCRLNSYGTAKAMEADVAVELVTRNPLLKKVNIEIGVFVGDNDSSSICSIQKAASHPVIKQSDTNHTSKGVKGLLFNIDKSKDPDKELTHDVIQYLHTCFTFGLAPNQGNEEKMAAVIKNIPYHAFNKHENCIGDWCGYKKDPEHYDHKVITGGLTNPILFEELRSIFEKISKNTEAFVAGASTQANESLNNMICRKAPKSVPYQSSESYPFRVACAIAEKNRNKMYLQDTVAKCKLSPASNMSKYVERSMKSAKIRSIKLKTPIYKLKRREAKQKRKQLKHRREKMEGTTYQSNVGLLSTPKSSVPIDACVYPTEDCNSLAVVYFDLETGGFDMSDDILQICAKYKNLVFNEYVKPTKPIHFKASELTGLSTDYGELYYRGAKVSCSPIRLVLSNLLVFLKSVGKKCVLLAHNGFKFDCVRLLTKIKSASLIEEFNSVVSSFSDSLVLFENRFPERKSAGKGSLKLTTLASEILHLPVDNAHDAFYDVVILEKLVLHHFSYDEIISISKSPEVIMEEMVARKNRPMLLKNLDPLDGHIPKALKERLANAHISFDLLVDTFLQGEENFSEFLDQRAKDTPIIKTAANKTNLIEFFKILFEIIQ